MPSLERGYKRLSYMPKPDAKPRQSSESDDGKFLNSARWKKTRAIYKRREPLCENCKHHNRTPFPPATCVDHIIPRSEGGALLDYDNLQALCNECHNRKSGKESHAGCLVETKEKGSGLVPKDKTEIFNILR